MGKRKRKRKKREKEERKKSVKMLEVCDNMIINAMFESEKATILEVKNQIIEKKIEYQ